MLAGESVGVNVVLYETKCHKECTLNSTAGVFKQLHLKFRRLVLLKTMFIWKSFLFNVKVKVFSVHR